MACGTSALSSLLGMASIGIWVVAVVPQLLANYRTKLVVGLSGHFLGLWLAGDSLNLLGCLLTHQLPFQTCLLLFFVMLDVCMCLQYVMYRRAAEKEHGTPLSVRPASPAISVLSAASFVQGAAGAVLVLSGTAPAAAGAAGAMSAAAPPAIGRFIAWCCTAVYLTSRLPQLWKNYKRQSTHGLLPLLFCCTIGGNVTYVLSILASCEFVNPATTRWDFFLKELPYMLGSGGTVLLDAAFFVQWYHYRVGHELVAVSSRSSFLY